MKRTFFIFILSGVWSGICAQDTVSLNRLLQQVQTNYPAIIQYQYNIQSLQSKAGGAKAWMAPTFSTGMMRFPYNLSMLNAKSDPMNQAGLTFSLEQMIPNTSKLNAKRDYLNSLTEVEKSKREWTKNELKREAKLLYYNRYSLEKQLLILKESEDVLTLLVSTAEEKYANNRSQLQTIYKAKARLAEIANMRLMINAQITESNIGINSLLLRDAGTNFRIDTLITTHDYFNISDTNSVFRRSDIAAVNRSIQSMKIEQRLMKISVRPDFGVRVEHMQMFGMPNQWSVMGMITIPIAPWSSKMYSSETQSIGFQIQSMEQEKKTMEIMAKRMVAEKLAMLNYQNQQYRSYTQKIIPAYENNLQANLLAYKQNTGDFFVLLDAWEMLLMKRLETYNKFFEILKLEAEYEYEKEIN